MARFSVRQFSFSNGEVSPLLWGRADMQFYFTALKRCENWIPDQFGTLHRRPGTRFAGEVDAKPCFYRFDAGSGGPSLVVATPGGFRFWGDGGEIGGEIGTPYGEGDYCDLQYVEDCGAAFIVHPDHQPRILQRQGEGFSLSIFDAHPYDEINSDEGSRLCLKKGGSIGDGTATLIGKEAAVGDLLDLTRDAGATTSTVAVTSYNGAEICEVDIPPDLDAGEYYVWDGSTEAELVTIVLDQAYLVSEGFSPFTEDMVGKSIRILDEEGVCKIAGGSGSVPERDQAIFVPNESGAGEYDQVPWGTNAGSSGFGYVENNAGDGGYDKTTVRAKFGDSSDLFGFAKSATEDEKNEPNTWVTVKVLSFVSADEVIVSYAGCELKCTDLFQLPAFGDGKHPSSVWIHQDRLWFGYENRVMGSKTGDFYDWEPTDADGTVNPDNAIYTRINAGACSEIQWMRTAGRQLIIGTTDNIQALLGAGVGGAFAADGVAQQHIQNIGVASIRPAQVADSLVFVDRTRHRIFGTGPGAQYDQVAVADQTLFADHIGSKRFRDIAYMEYPFPIVWATTDDGGLYSMTYWPEQNVRGWARHTLGGGLVEGACDRPPRVCDIEVQRSSDGTKDIFYLAVERTVNGSRRYFIETLGDFFSHFSSEEEAHYLDCALPLKVLSDGVFSASRSGPWIDGGPAPAGRVAWRDSDRWYFGSSDGARIAADTPNTFEVVHGATMVEDGAAWRWVDRPQYGSVAEYVPEGACLYRPPCGISQLAIGFDRISGMAHLEGESVVAWIDGHDEGARVIASGEVDLPGCLAWVGYPYVSDLEFLPFRAGLGGSDGANDPSKVAAASFYVYRTPELRLGTGCVNHVDGVAEAFELVAMPEEFETHHRRFHSGWVKGVPFSRLGRNDSLGFTLRAQGPYPAIIRNMEATIYASGGE